MWFGGLCVFVWEWMDTLYIYRRQAGGAYVRHTHPYMHSHIDIMVQCHWRIHIPSHHVQASERAEKLSTDRKGGLSPTRSAPWMGKRMASPICGDVFWWCGRLLS